MPGEENRAKEGPDSITDLLGRLSKGDRAAEEKLVPAVYGELRRIASHYMRHERQNHTLQPTALVNEAYARLFPTPDISWEGRSHFFAVASQLMRRVLVDYARAKKADKRGGAQQQITLVDMFAAADGQDLDVLALNEALDRLAELDERQSKIVELHFFGGLPFEEIGQMLGVATRTVTRDWSMARAWLRTQLSGPL
jgi:RNA polymerase sigma-70 factor (ECF subfamily)